MLLCPKVDLMTIQNKVKRQDIKNKVKRQDIIESCTQERQNTKWRFKLTNNLKQVGTA